MELMVGNTLEKMFQEKKQGIHNIQDTDWIVDFSNPDQVSKAHFIGYNLFSSIVISDSTRRRKKDATS